MSKTPMFTCRVCHAVMCPACKDWSAHYEAQSSFLGIELLGATERIRELERKLELSEAMLSDWRNLATIGFPEHMKQWMKSEVWIKATRPPAKERAKIRKKLSDQLRRSLIEGDHHA